MEFDIYRNYIAASLVALLVFVGALFRKRLGTLGASLCLIAGLGIVPVWLLAAQFLKFEAFKNYLDLAVWLQLVQSIAQGNGPYSQLMGTVYPGTEHWFSCHFTPLLYLFGWAYSLVPHPQTILFIQWAFLMLGAHACYLYGSWRLGTRRSGLCCAAVYLLHPTVQYIALYEFEMLRFASPVLLYLVYFLERERKNSYWLFLVLALLIREEVALTTFCLGLYACFCLPNRRWCGAVTCTISLVYFMVVAELVLPSFRTAGAGYVASQWFASGGSSPVDMAINIALHPLATLGVVFDPIKIANVVFLLLPLAFLSLFGGPLVLVCCGNLGVNLLSSSMTHTSYFLYYIAPSLPILCASAIKGVGPFTEICRRNIGRLRDLSSDSVLNALLSVAVVAGIFLGPAPFSLQFLFRGYRLAPFRTQNFHYSQYVIDARNKTLHEMATLLPANSIVSSEQHLLPIIYGKAGLVTFPDLTGATHALFDKKRAAKTGIGTVADSWDGFRQDPQKYYDFVEADPAHWRLVQARDDFFLYERIGALP